MPPTFPSHLTAHISLQLSFANRMEDQIPGPLSGLGPSRQAHPHIHPNLHALYVPPCTLHSGHMQRAPALRLAHPIHAFIRLVLSCLEYLLPFLLTENTFYPKPNSNIIH